MRTETVDRIVRFVLTCLERRMFLSETKEELDRIQAKITLIVETRADWELDDALNGAFDLLEENR